MHKLFVAVFSLAFLGSISVWAQEQSANQSEETTLDKEADNLNIVSYEERLRLKNSNTKALKLKLKNTRKGEISDIIKNRNLAEKRAARLEERTPEVESVDPTDKEKVRKFLQKDLFIDPYPPFILTQDN